MRDSDNISVPTLLKSFRDDKRGVILPLFAILSVIMIVTAGAAIDLSRAVNQREKLSYALDAAALSAATDLSVSLMTNSEIRNALENSLKANLAGEPYLDEALANMTFTVDSSNGTIDVQTDADVDTFFIHLGGYGLDNIGPSAIKVGTSSEVAFSQFNVELALVVDVTGSMSYQDMSTLRQASNEIVNTLIPAGTAGNDSKVRISLIPYSQGVNLGPYAAKVKGADYGHSDGNNCVTERMDFTEGTANYAVSATDDPFDYYDGPAPPAQAFFGGGSVGCSNSSQMLPLTADRDTLVTSIGNLNASGGTAGQTGVAWGWYSLSPNFSDLWPVASAPAAYADTKTLKFAVIMTDGDNNRYYRFQQGESDGSSDSSCPNWSWSGCSWSSFSSSSSSSSSSGGSSSSSSSFGSSSFSSSFFGGSGFGGSGFGGSGFGGSGFGNSSSDESSSDGGWEEVGEPAGETNVSSTRAQALCAGMKAAGVEVFGVYFGSDNNSTGARNMQACASPGNYLHATSSADLINAFGNIAKKIQSIYISS